jgi:hypothetical protein
LEAALLALEQFAVVQAIKSSFYVYPVISAAHIAAIGALLTTVVILDLRLLGWIGAFADLRSTALLRSVAIGAFAVAAISGILMFAVRASEYALMPLFWAKLGLIAAAIANFWFVSRIEARAVGRPMAVAPPRVPLVASLILWPSVLLAGRFLGFV